MLAEGKVKTSPWFSSNVQDEGLYPAVEFYSDNHLPDINENWLEYAPFILTFNDSTSDFDKKRQISLDMQKHYMGIQPITKRNFGAFNDVRKFGSSIGQQNFLTLRFKIVYFFFQISFQHA